MRGSGKQVIARNLTNSMPVVFTPWGTKIRGYAKLGNPAVTGLDLVCSISGLRILGELEGWVREF